MLEQSYTAAEVASNNGKNGAKVWIIIKGVVYDVTPFLDDHPGGADLIMEFAGKDATKAFYQAGHSSDASADLKKYRIGVIAEKNSPVMSAEKNSKLTDNGSQATLASTKSEKRKRIKFLFCV